MKNQPDEKPTEHGEAAEKLFATLTAQQEEHKKHLHNLLLTHSADTLMKRQVQQYDDARAALLVLPDLRISSAQSGKDADKEGKPVSVAEVVWDYPDALYEYLEKYAPEQLKGGSRLLTLAERQALRENKS